MTERMYILLSWIWWCFHFIHLYSTILWVPSHIAQCIWTVKLPTNVPQYTVGVSRKTSYDSQTSLCATVIMPSSFLPSLLFTCTHAPWLLCSSQGVLSLDAFKTLNFWTNRKILDPESEKRRMSCLLGTWGLLPFHFLYFPSLAVLSDPVKLETEGQMAIKWSQKDEQSTRLLSIYLLSTFAVLGIVLSP